MRKIFILIFSLLMVNSYSQERRVITTAVPFLMIASDARAAGMGEQGVATSVDNFSQHWNPAKYVFSEREGGVGFSYTPYLSKLVNDVFLANSDGTFESTKIEPLNKLMCLKLILNQLFWTFF